MKAIEYRNVESVPDWQVGTDGSVWTKSRFGPRGQEQRGEYRRLKPLPDCDGYLRLTPSKQSPIGVHILVLRAFVGPCPKGMEACHGDGNPANNNLSNLRWDTPSNNNLEKRKHGTDQVGLRNGNSKLTEEAVRDIKANCRPYGAKARLARKYGVSTDTIQLIAQNRTWRHIV